MLASETLEALRHHLGTLLESFLTLRTNNLTFQEVVDCVLKENHQASQQLLHHLRGCHVDDREVLEGLIKAHGELDKSDKAARKSLKKEIDQRHKSLEMLKERFSYYETQLNVLIVIACFFCNKVRMLFNTLGESVVHWQDHLLLSQLCLTSLQSGRNKEPKGSNWCHLSELINRTPPSKSDTAPFLAHKASANQRLSHH